jgi:cytochrome c553
MPASLAALFIATIAINADDSKTAAQAFFEKSVRPLFASRCHSCHGPNSPGKGGLFLSSRDAILKGGSRGPAVVPNDPEKSLLLKAVSRVGDLKMPPDAPLSKTEIALLRRWISDGAVWEATSSQQNQESQASLWAFRPVVEGKLPSSPLDHWCEGPIDRFIAHRLSQANLEPNPPADDLTWFRRVSFDLIGLPPTVEELHAWQTRDRPDAKERLVDRLLSSPRYAERWARRWLDVVRYAETNGFEDDFEKPNAFRFRDYVINAFNIDLPYDLFVREQIAGDLLSPPRMSLDGFQEESPVGSGFWWLGEIMPLPFCVEDARKIAANEVETQVDTYGKAFLGLTIACARCHDHKFDPIPTEDYYALAGAVMSTTNVQQSIESRHLKEKNHAERVLLEKLDSEIHEYRSRPEIVQRLKQIERSAAEKIASFILSDGLIAGNTGPVGPHQVIDANRIERWKNLIRTALPSKHPVVYPWARLNGSDNVTYERRAESLIGYLDEIQSRLPSMKQPKQALGLFDHKDFDDWTATGEAFGDGPISWSESRTAGVVGSGMVSSDRGADHLTGRIVSPPFKVTEENRYLYFLIAGGNTPFRTCVNLVLHSQAMPQRPPFWTASGLGDHYLRQHWFDLQYYMNMEVFIEIVDASSDPGGFISADHFFFAPTAPPSGEFAFVHPFVQDALRGVRTKEEFANRFQTLCLRALDQPESLDNSLDRQPWNTLRQWLRSDDSPLLTPIEAEAHLPLPMRDHLAQLRSRRDQLAVRCRPSQLAMVSKDRRQVVDASIQPGGEASKESPTVPRGIPRHLPGPSSPRLAEGSQRLALAEWTASAENPLTPRIMVNRVWAGHFKRGIVPSTDNFGTLGDQASHPELLDHLARRFMDEGWSLKWLHRQMVLSKTYGQSSQPVPNADAKDPDNRWFHRANLRRLEAEAIRDSILAVSGALDDQFGGPSIPLPVALNVELNPIETPGTKPDERRRSVYIQVRRNHAPTLFEAFDFPSRPETVGDRAESALPIQALDLLNSEFLAVSAARWEEHSRSEAAETQEQRISQLYVAAFGRYPDEKETTIARNMINRQKQLYSNHLSATEADRKAWSDYCHVLFNVGEFIYIR